MKVVLASKNPHKLVEISKITEKFGFELVLQSQLGVDIDVEETGTTFAENAALKACGISAALPGLVLADDSGLCVDALNGAPGVYSARYAQMNDEGEGDKDNNNLLLRRMKGKNRRQCAFQCAIALAIPGQPTRIAEGSCPGVLLEELRGTGGFGYDPLFLYEPLNKTFAEVTDEEKNAISHRGKAMRLLVEFLVQHTGEH